MPHCPYRRIAKKSSAHALQVGQGVGEKLFVGGAFVYIYTLALATVFAHRKITALLALVLYYHTFFDKLDGNSAREELPVSRYS